jgi:nitrogenase molybdenum-iron protein alpha/beta subunit
MATEKTTLEDFAAKGLHLGKMTGVMLGAHAISDSFLLMHSGVGCKYKTAAQAATHDLVEHPNVREAWTQVSEAHLVAGCSSRLGPFARAWWERRNSALMVVVSAYFIELTGDDVRSGVEDMAKTVPDCDSIYIDTAAPSAGFFDGYASVLWECVKKMDWATPPTKPEQVSVIGHFFHRYEPDMIADVAQLRELIELTGLTPGPILFSGDTYADARRAPESKVVIELPYARPYDRKMRRLYKKRDLAQCDLPMGFGGTRRFVRTLAEAAGRDLAAVDARLDAAETETRDKIHVFRELLQRISLAVFADTPLAAGLVTLLTELGVHVPLVGLRDQDGCLGGKVAFFETLLRNGVTDHSHLEVLVTPSLRTVQREVLRRAGEGLAGAIGSTHELDTLVHVPRSRAMSADAVLLEVGFPSNNYHAVYEIPNFGFEGVIAWAHRIREAYAQPRIGREAPWLS